MTDIAGEALAKLAAYHWPGKVRELGNTIERAVVLGTGPVLKMEDLPGRISVLDLRLSVTAFSYRQAMEARRRELVTKALEQSHGSRAGAARILGLHEKYFLRLIKTLNIS